MTHQLGDNGNQIDPEEKESAKRRLFWLIAAIALVVLAIIIAVSAALSGRTDAEDPSLSPSAPTSSESASPTPGASEEPGESDGAVPDVVAEVPVGTAGDFGDGVSATVSAVTPLEVEGRGPGEKSGPALRFDIVMSNGSAAAIPLDGVTVNLYYGADSTPASPVLSNPEIVEFGGTLEPGATAPGSYVFSLPAEGQADYHLEISYSAGSPLVMVRP
ncbi:hypothetical protein [Homoserinimonas hongtaonis]|uniref:DUF4352 domain-containing protein n=1 Tax=Homoserinimonas hongtaonis TaxID=2079791 RepID=A0A2U1T1B7_9MICO|nr:hypothetical protein [Salinibacterium hongtaonis]PWB97573.1 hypothetical protein DF220_06825 [Salinibacterium hongtaonis]